MCGIMIIKKDQTRYVRYGIQHRGYESNRTSTKNWDIFFESLPLSSNNTGINQPILLKNGGMLMMNGEIFNYPLKYLSDLHYLQDLFESMNYDIYELWKYSLSFDGFWSIAYIDPQDSLHFFTDPLGKKQLYMADKGLCSEIKPLLDVGTKLLPYDENIFTYYPKRTPFDGITRAIPGKLYHKGAKDLFFHENPEDLRSYRHSVLLMRDYSLYDLIEESVMERTINRIDGVTLFLSGGLDSNIILHFLIKNHVKFQCLTIENGETEMVDRIQKHYNIDILYIPDSFQTWEFAEAVAGYEHPYDLGSLIPNYKLFKAATNKVCLTGDGADELFGGYGRNLETDTQQFDVFKELPFYHNVRLDRMSMMFTKECRSPLMSYKCLEFALKLPWEDRKNKKYLRQTFRNHIPDFILDGPKSPLRLLNNKQFNLEKTKNIFYHYNF